MEENPEYFVDTHAHLYDEQFKEDLAIVMQAAGEASIRKIFLPNVDSHTIDAMLAVEANYPQCFAMMGLHPCSVKGNYKEELEIVKSWLDKRPFVAVGEIGLDLYWDKTFYKEQLAAFEQQIDWALAKNLPIVIHSREATNEVIEVLKGYKGRGLRGIFHCFTGSKEEAEQIVELGMMLGIGGVFTFKKARLEDSLRDIGLEHIVLETDAPYLAPMPFRGKRNESAYIYNIALSMQEKLGWEIKKIRQKTTENALKLFKLEQ